MSCVLGLDVSTTATKAFLVDEAGAVVGHGAAEYGVDAPRPGWSEQDPREWWDAARGAVTMALAAGPTPPADVRAIGLTGQMHGAVLLDARGDVLRPAILWNDQRSVAECDLIRQRIGVARLLATTGNDALPGFTASKLLWVERHEPEIWRRIAHILLPKDYIRYRLTGAFATDKADGSGTQLFDLPVRDWSTVMLAALEIDPAWLPETFEGPEVTGALSEATAAAIGLPPGLPVVAGAGDQAANAVGVGAVTSGITALSLGTSGVVFASTDRPVIEPHGRVQAFCHAVPGRWHMMSVMLSAAGSLRWFRDTLAPGEPYGDLAASADGVAAAADGLFFLPYLDGERSPHPDPLARGAFVGLSTGHDRRHMVRAVLEGVAFGLRDGLDLMVAAGVPRPSEIRASGGGLASPVWRQILADVLDATLATPSTTEGAAFGAATLATVAAGWYTDLPAAVGALVRPTPAASPGPARAAYRAAHAGYRDLYPALAPTFHRDGRGHA